MRPVLAVWDQLWAFYFGRADTWLGWLLAFSLIFGLLAVFMDGWVHSETAIMGWGIVCGVSAAGVALRNWRTGKRYG